MSELRGPVLARGGPRVGGRGLGVGEHGDGGRVRGGVGQRGRRELDEDGVDSVPVAV